ncbi:hypothetical protein [Gordonia sp. FQ]|uniref:hypothetical protein n=1 Tax=Gordonia sp. FQ TaxID=3446634 RepID=UPI003F864240
MPDDDSPRDPRLPPTYHRHASGAENHDPDAVHPQRPAGTPPPPKNKHRTRNLILAGIGTLAALAIVVGVIAATAGRSDSPTIAGPSITGYQLPPKPPECADGVAGQRHPASGLDLGDVLVPRKELPPGWRTSDIALPFATAAQIVTPPPAPAASPSPPTTSGNPPASTPPAPNPPLFGLVQLPKDSGTDLRAAGERFLRCLIYIPRYASSKPMPPAIVDSRSARTENGVDYLQLTARLTTGEDEQRGGDVVNLVVIGTVPITMAVVIAPLTDERAPKAQQDRQREQTEQIQKALRGLQIRAPQR